ncbi:hypothetical protein LPJ61_006597, partial [Coemansia biformis]
MFVPVNQDHSPGSINAFGGPGATVGINAFGPGGDGNGAGGSIDGRKAALPLEFKNDKQSGDAGSGHAPITQSVKDAALYSQLQS